MGLLSITVNIHDDDWDFAPMLYHDYSRYPPLDLGILRQIGAQPQGGLTGRHSAQLEKYIHGCPDRHEVIAHSMKDIHDCLVASLGPPRPFSPPRTGTIDDWRFGSRKRTRDPRFMITTALGGATIRGR